MRISAQLEDECFKWCSTVAPKRKGAGPKPKGFCSSIGNAIVGNVMGEPGHLGIINVAAKII